MDDKDFRQAMKLYRSAPVTHVAPETGSLAAPQKKDIAHREKARVWFPRQTPADSALQPEGGDEGRQPEEQPEETMQGAVTVYQEKKVVAYGRMEKVDVPEAIDAPDVPLADAMSADNPPCDVDYRVVSDGEVLQLGMDEEPVVSGEGPVSDSSFENMIASVEAGLASMLAEGPPAVDDVPVAGEGADDETAALLAGMSEEERAEIAGFDLSLLKEDEPEADHPVSPEEALTAGLSKEELAEIAGFDPALLAAAPELVAEEEVTEPGAEAVSGPEPGEGAATDETVAIAAIDGQAEEAAVLAEASEGEQVAPLEASLPEQADAVQEVTVVNVAIPEADSSVAASGEVEETGEPEETTGTEEERPAETIFPEESVDLPEDIPAEESAARAVPEVVAEESVAEPDAEAVSELELGVEAMEEANALAEGLEAAPTGEAFSGEGEPLTAAGTVAETNLLKAGHPAGGEGIIADEGTGEETVLTADAGRTEQVSDLFDMRNESELDDAGALVGDAVPEQTTEMAALAREGETGQAETGRDALLGGMASDGAETLPDAEVPQAAIEEEGEAQAVEAPLHDAGGDNLSETGAVGLSAERIEEEPTADDAFASAAASQGEATEAAAQAGPEASDSGMPATDREEGAVLVDMQGASEPEDEAAEAMLAGEAFSGEAETLSVAGIAPERVEEEPTADVAFAGATASEGEATEAAAQAGLETAVEEGITETGEEAVSVPEPAGEAAAAAVDAIATEDESADGAAALAAVLKAAQDEQAAGVQEEIPGDAVMPEAGSNGIPAGDEEAASEPQAAIVTAEVYAAKAAASEGAVLPDAPEAEKPAEAETGEKAEEAIMAGEGKTAEALLPEASMENPSEAGAAGFAVETVEAGETGPETAVDEGIAESGGEAVSVPEPGREATAAEQTEEADAGISAGALPDPETALADGILLAEGEALPAAPVSAPDGITAGLQEAIPEEEAFRDKMQSHQRNRMAFAEYKVAAAYAREGTEAAYQEAIKWYTRAAEKGHAVSRFNLGNIYYAGRGVVQDYARAADWYELAARQGVARAQDNLGLMFFHGRGRPVEPETAVYWFRQAAIQGYAPAQYKLAIHLEAGVGVAANRAEALYWYRKAASQGHEQAEKEAARLEEEGRR